eukprot:1850005-Rhodomonas_salina.1
MASLCPLPSPASASAPLRLAPSLASLSAVFLPSSSPSRSLSFFLSKFSRVLAPALSRAASGA